MPVILTYLILASSAVFGVLLMAEVLTLGISKRWLIELVALVGALGTLHLITGFPSRSQRQSFGDAEILGLIAAIYISIMLGMAARYFFYLRGRFKWRSFLKPLCVSPIVLLPLLGTLPFGNTVEPIQWIFFAVLGFQNGFFWRVVFERAQNEA